MGSVPLAVNNQIWFRTHVSQAVNIQHKKIKSNLLRKINTDWLALDEVLPTVCFSQIPDSSFIVR